MPPKITKTLRLSDGGVFVSDSPIQDVLESTRDRLNFEHIHMKEQRYFPDAFTRDWLTKLREDVDPVLAARDKTHTIHWIVNKEKDTLTLYVNHKPMYSFSYSMMRNALGLL